MFAYHNPLICLYEVPSASLRQLGLCACSMLAAVAASLRLQDLATSLHAASYLSSSSRLHAVAIWSPSLRLWSMQHEVSMGQPSYGSLPAISHRVLSETHPLIVPQQTMASLRPA